MKHGISGLELRHVLAHCYDLAGDVHAGPVGLHAPVQRIHRSRANPQEMGLGAISLTRAGVDVELPASPATTRVVGLSALAALVFAVLAFA